MLSKTSYRLLKFPTEDSVESILKRDLFQELGNINVSSYFLDNQLFQTIKIQLVALKLVNVKYSATTQGSMALFWSLTPEGQALMFKLRTVKEKKGESSGPEVPGKFRGKVPGAYT